MPCTFFFSLRNFPILIFPTWSCANLIDRVVNCERNNYELQRCWKLHSEKIRSTILGERNGMPELDRHTIYVLRNPSCCLINELPPSVYQWPHNCYCVRMQCASLQHMKYFFILPHRVEWIKHAWRWMQRYAITMQAQPIDWRWNSCDFVPLLLGWSISCFASSVWCPWNMYLKHASHSIEPFNPIGGDFFMVWVISLNFVHRWDIVCRVIWNMRQK